MDASSFRMHWPAFIIAFGIGLLYVYMSQPAQKVVVKYPTPFNAGKVVYSDDAETCFKFDATRVKCPKDAVKQPVVVM